MGCRGQKEIGEVPQGVSRPKCSRTCMAEGPLGHDSNNELRNVAPDGRHAVWICIATCRIQ